MTQKNNYMYQLYTGCHMNEGFAFTVLVNPHDNPRATGVISPNIGVAFPLWDGKVTPRGQVMEDAPEL